MKKLIGFIILLSVASCSTVPSSQKVEEVQPGFVILDVLFYRPVGLAATVIGTAAFIGISPFTALASIPAPHDAFVKTGKILILSPAVYTFIRPVGDRSFPYHIPRYKQRLVAGQNKAGPYKKTVVPRQPSLTPAVPDAQSPRRYRKINGGL